MLMRVPLDSGGPPAPARHVMSRAMIIGALAVALGTSPVQAQALFSSSDVELHTATPLPAAVLPAALFRSEVRRAAARDHRWEGLGIGAGVVGLLGAIVLHGTCEANESCTGPTIGGFAMGAVVGGVVGGLIGAQIPKGPQ